MTMHVSSADDYACNVSQKRRMRTQPMTCHVADVKAFYYERIYTHTHTHTLPSSPPPLTSSSSIDYHPSTLITAPKTHAQAYIYTRTHHHDLAKGAKTMGGGGYHHSTHSTRTSIHIHTHMHMHTHTQTHTHTRTSIHIHINTHKHTYAHTHTHVTVTWPQAPRRFVAAQCAAEAARAHGQHGHACVW